MAEAMRQGRKGFGPMDNDDEDDYGDEEGHEDDDEEDDEDLDGDAELDEAAKMMLMMEEQEKMYLQ
jgi:hypothetical protein